MSRAAGRARGTSSCPYRRWAAYAQFDAVCEFIGFMPEQVERDIRLFRGRTRQYVYISSASAYAKPVRSPYITEGTALANPHWQYSRNKIACEELLMRVYRENGSPVTIVRPSHTYCEHGVPVSIHGPKGSWPVLKRMLEGKPVLVHDDGSSLWTLTWNEDFARGFIGLLGNPKAIGEAFQIMSDESLTWDQIYALTSQALFSSLPSASLPLRFPPLRLPSLLLPFIHPVVLGGFPAEALSRRLRLPGRRLPCRLRLRGQPHRRQGGHSHLRLHETEACRPRLPGHDALRRGRPSLYQLYSRSPRATSGRPRVRPMVRQGH